MISLEKVTKAHGKRYLYQDASFQINPAERVGLVGPNGAGKTTLFRLIVGEESADAGTVTIPERFVIGYFSQDPARDTDATVLAAAMAGSGDLQRLESEIETCSARLADPDLDAAEMEALLERLGEAQHEFEAQGGYDVEARAQVILGGLGFGPEDLHKPVSAFSGGWRMRIELAKVLLRQPDALLLDEPTNHLDVESIVWLEEFLAQYKGAIFMTSHDRDFLNRLVRKVVALEWGQVTVYSGDYDFYERESAIRLENLEAQAERQEAFLEKEEKFIARFKARASHASQVQSRIKMIEKLDRVEVPKEGRAVDFRWLPCGRSGDIVADLTGVSKAYGPRQVLEDVAFQVKRLEKVAVLGINGAGKSTLLKILAGELAPDKGNCRLGASLQVGYFAQHYAEQLDPQKTVYEAVQEVVPTVNRGVIQNLLGSLRFSGDDVEKKISVLSGGEKTRVVLARIVAKPVNFLILDEPTNHLDMKSRAVLVQAIRDFDGTVVFVSHDRHFLREVATKVVLVDRGHTTEFPGGLAYFLEKSGNKVPGSEYTLRIG
ncbi:MAG: ABC-F family ATP-binding cassette domain-containing protein [Candidatus Sericytochromatia bacterium]|nr:ABC-F family ATP-binding cassette domain-containing protein [Candidatus Tanganyikabacteria bacterium]